MLSVPCGSVRCHRLCQNARSAAMKPVGECRALASKHVLQLEAQHSGAECNSLLPARPGTAIPASTHAFECRWAPALSLLGWLVLE